MCNGSEFNRFKCFSGYIFRFSYGRARGCNRTDSACTSRSHAPSRSRTPSCGIAQRDRSPGTSCSRASRSRRTDHSRGEASCAGHRRSSLSDKLCVKSLRL